METQNNEPNLFLLTGKDTQITYSASSFTGQPQLHYQDHQRNLSFTGDQIRSLDTEIGSLITVNLEDIPDFRTITLTLLLPTINLGELREISFATQAILTTHHTSIGGPQLLKGALQTYRVMQLHGTAKVVEF